MGANFIIRSEISGGSCSREHLPEGFIHFHHGVDGYAREEKIFVLIMGEDVDVFVSSNMETWINENSRLSDTVLRFLVALMWESQYAWRVCGNGLPFSADERRS